MTTEVHLQRTLPASPAAAWRALTEPAALCAWFWPHERFGTIAEADLRVDGTFRIEAPKAGIGVTGRYLELRPTERMQPGSAWYECTKRYERTSAAAGRNSRSWSSMGPRKRAASLK
jgi:uncharacterized protein YndB with AHSA1/START domain